jgi:predicted RNA-binding protein YlqC (UPF0109 family)
MNLNPAPPPFESPEKETLLPSYSSFQTTFATLSLHMADRIRLLQFPASDIDAIRNVIRAKWRKGIQADRKYAMSHEFKLHGNPWWGQGSDSIPARIVMREIFAYLYSAGWILHASTDLSKKERDKDTLVFRKQQHPPPQSEWISISFNQSDRLRLIGADGELIAAFRTMLKGMQKLQNEGWKDQILNTWEFKIRGTPWWASGEETMVTRMMILNMLETLERYGWSLYASIDQNQAGEDSSETDSWFCTREKGWVPGSSVFHR